jgi:hypothetical protein
MASGSLEELTASFSKKEGIFIRLKKTGEEVFSLLKTIPGVEQVAEEDDGFILEWTKGKDIREEISKFIVEKELGLLEMRPFAMNIEDLYLKVISGGMEQ